MENTTTLQLFQEVFDTDLKLAIDNDHYFRENSRYITILPDKDNKEIRRVLLLLATKLNVLYFDLTSRRERNNGITVDKDEFETYLLNQVHELEGN
jgi:hypothetical protein